MGTSFLIYFLLLLFKVIPEIIWAVVLILDDIKVVIVDRILQD